MLLKLDDAVPETITTIPTTRANLVCFTSDKVSKHNVCPQGSHDKLKQTRLRVCRLCVLAFTMRQLEMSRGCVGSDRLSQPEPNGSPGGCPSMS